MNKSITHTFQNYPEEIRTKLLFLRERIFHIAKSHQEIGIISEELKWDNPSYLTHSPKSGTTLRLSKRRSATTEYAMSVHCQSTLISDFKVLYPQQNYDGNRSIIFDVNGSLPLEIVDHFIFLALTYHHRRQKR